MAKLKLKSPARNQPAPQAWREVVKVHPAAELLPRMSDAELRELGEDICAATACILPVVIFADQDGTERLLDGRNRLDAMELVRPADCQRLRTRIPTWFRPATFPATSIRSCGC